MKLKLKILLVFDKVKNIISIWSNEHDRVKLNSDQSPPHPVIL